MWYSEEVDKATTNAALVLLMAGVAALLGDYAAEGFWGEPATPPAAEPTRAPEEHPEAVHQGERATVSEAPIVEKWEDEYFPFVGFQPEVKDAAAVKTSGPSGARSHALGDMVAIPAGPVTVGDADLPGSRPVRTVELPAYSIDRYEVTCHQYRDFIRATNRRAPYVHENWAAVYNWYKDTYQAGHAELPVILVTWNDADAYCRWANKRLPTELEWEKAARGAADARRYPWGDVWDSTLTNVASRLSGPLRTVAEWDAFEEAWTGSKKPEIFGVGQYPSDVSPFGVYDMAGNVSEWVSDLWAPVPGAPPGDRKGFGEELRVARGNSWGNRDYSAPLSIRYPYEEGRVDSVIGFRCARSGH